MLPHPYNIIIYDIKLIFILWPCHHKLLQTTGTKMLLTHARYYQWACVDNTVDSLLMDTPNNRPLPNNGHCYMYISIYMLNTCSSITWIVDNLWIPDNGHSSLHEVIQYYTKNVPTNGRQWVRLTPPTTFLHAVHGIINNLYKNNKTAIHIDTKKR